MVNSVWLIYYSLFFNDGHFVHCFQDYQIDFFFRQQWYDPRLRHAYRNTLTVSNAMLDRIWVPDTYFENSKNSYFHEVTVPNKMLKIKPDGTILYNARYTQVLKTLTFLVPIPQNGQTHSHNSSAIADQLFECA